MLLKDPTRSATLRRLMATEVRIRLKNVTDETLKYLESMTLNASACGAGSEGAPGFQPGNTCGAEESKSEAALDASLSKMTLKLAAEHYSQTLSGGATVLKASQHYLKAGKGLVDYIDSKGGPEDVSHLDNPLFQEYPAAAKVLIDEIKKVPTKQVHLFRGLAKLEGEFNIGQTVDLDRITSFAEDESQAAYYASLFGGKKNKDAVLIELRGSVKTIETDALTGLSHKEHITFGKFRVVDVRKGKRVRLPEAYDGSTTFRQIIVIEPISVANFDPITTLRAHIEALCQQYVLQPWWDQYLDQAYDKGAGRAFDDLHKTAPNAQHLLDVMVPNPLGGVRAQFVRQLRAKIVQNARSPLSASRVYTDFKGVTDEMQKRIIQTVISGLESGLTPRGLAIKIRAVSQKSMTRAYVIAQTEITRAHADGQLDAMGALGLTHVSVLAEWETREDGRVCPMCSSMDGVVLTLQQARGLIPRHPQCRCAYKVLDDRIYRKGQKRSPAKIQTAIDASVKHEGGKRRSLQAAKRRSQWAGAKKRIRPTKVKGGAIKRARTKLIPWQMR